MTSTELNRNSVDCWYLRIARSATVPGLFERHMRRRREPLAGMCRVQLAPCGVRAGASPLHTAVHMLRYKTVAVATGTAEAATRAARTKAAAAAEARAEASACQRFLAPNW